MNIKLILYILTFLFNLFPNIEIIIPFTSSLSGIPKNLTPIYFMDSLITNTLNMNINIGTPPQNLDVLIDFNSYHTIIIKDNNNNINNKRFYYNNSLTYISERKKIYFYNLDFLSAINASDLVTINENITDFNYTFLHVIDTMSLPKKKLPGVIGFGVVSNGQPFFTEAGLIYQLKHKNITNNYIFSLIFNKNDFNGKIIIGKKIYENSTKNFMNDYCIITTSYTYYWGWNYITSFLDMEQLQIKKLFFKPEFGVIILNSKIKNSLKNKFFDEKIRTGKCYEDYKKYSFFYCDKDIKINIGRFIFKNNKKDIDFYLDSNDLILEYNNKVYFLIVFDAHLSEDEAYLGYPFFKKYDVIFNQDNRNVGFYNNSIINKNKEIQNDIDYDNKIDFKKDSLIKKLLPFLLILIIIIIMYIIFYIYRKMKRKYNEKLYEELNEPCNN